MKRIGRSTLLLVAVVLLAVTGAPWAASIVAQDTASAQDGLVGEVTEVLDQDSFLLCGDILVMTDSLSVFAGGVEGVEDLVPGDLVQVDGYWLDDATYFAEQVVLLQRAAGPVTVQGQVAYVELPDLLVLADGLLVLVDQTTSWVGLEGLAGLAPGELVEVTGYADASYSWLAATEVRLLETGTPDTVSFQGIVAELLADGVVLEDGTVILVDQDTVFSGFSTLSELVPGSVLWIEAVALGSPWQYRALTLTLLDQPQSEVDLILLVDSVLNENAFTTVEGYTVLTDAFTALDGIGSVLELQPGDEVYVVGVLDESDRILASSVTLLDGWDSGGGGGSGLVTEVVGTVDLLLPPDAFVLDGATLIWVTPETTWGGGLTGFYDLEEGMTVQATVEWQQDGTLVALAVEAMGGSGTGLVHVSGTVVAVPVPGEVILDDGSDVVVTQQTVIDGDADAPEDLAVGMLVSGTCVPRASGKLEALSIFVEAPVSPDEFSGLEEDEASEALVVLAPGAHAAVVAGRHGASLEGRLPGRSIVLLRWPEPLPQSQVEALLQDPDVVAVEANYRFRDPESIRRRMPIADRSPTTDRFVRQPAAEQINLPEAHSVGMGEGTLVAVVDTGVEPLHPLLRRRIAEGGRDFVDGDDAPWETRNGIDDDEDGDVDEAAGHGTFVAGLILLSAPGARIVPYRVLDDDGRGSTFAVCEAILAAMDRGVDVINLSLVYHRRSRVLDRLLDEATARGIVLVSGTGNDGDEELPFPAKDHRVISVAAATASGEVAGFSNAAPDVTIAAPGEDLYSALLDGGFGEWSGTSMAAPLVSGTVAVMRSLNHRLTPEQILAALVQSAAPLAGQSRGVSGLLDAAAAVALIPGGQ